MNKHNDNTISHEQLCAYVFGEAEPELRERVERALASDEGLRAQHDALSATIGLVQDTCATSEGLAPEILATLEAASKPAPQANPWYSSTPVRMAAGLAALAAGVLGGRAMLQEEAISPAGKTELAQLDEVKQARDGAGAHGRGTEAKQDPASDLYLQDFDTQVAQGASLPGEQPEANAALGKLRAEFERQQQLPDKSDASEKRVARIQAKLPADGANTTTQFGEVVVLDELAAPGQASIYHLEADKSFAGATQTLGVEQLQDLTGIGYTSGDAARAGEPATESTLRFAGTTEQSGSTVVGGVTDAPATSGGSYKGPGDSAPPSKAGAIPESRTASDSFFLGHGQQDPKNATPELALRERAKSKTYLGGPASPSAGGAGGGPSSPGPAGPSSPGPSGPFTPGPASPSASAATPNTDTRELSAGRFEARADGKRVALDSDTDGEDFGWAFYEELDKNGSSSDDRGRGYLELTPQQVDELCKQRVSRILQSCRRHPNERPRDMFFRYWGDNAFELTRLDQLSTFSVDVDTASYALARRYLAEGTLPEKAQIRTEEFVNYFKPDVAAPTEEVFAVHTDLTPSRFGADATSGNQRYMLRVVVRGREVAASERKPLALTFVVDVSGSMKEGGRLELVKHSLRLLASQLDGNDSLSIVAFSTEARLVLPMTSAANRGVIEAAVYGLHPDGGTNAEAGLKLGYEVANTALSSAVHNRVVLLSDGVANIGQTDQDRLNADVRARRDSGIFLNTIGVGMSNHNDAFLEQLADKGDGLCNYIDTAVEARRALVENFTGAFEPIARDVKIQVDFDAEQVYRYRLLGYENRAIADADFRNDAVDAGEVGAGHQVVALYELELTGAKVDAPMAQVNLRWKAPTGAGRHPNEDSASERNFPVSVEALTTWEGASNGYKRSTLVAQFAEILRRSVHARNDSLDELISESVKLAQVMQDADLNEFVAMLQKSRELIVRHTPRRDTLTMCVDSIRRNHILRAQYEELRQTENHAVIEELERQNLQLEARIEELIRGEVQQRIK